jgi:hypothetical protein
MVFLTSLNILDTGFLSLNTRTNQLPQLDRVNNGVALQLKGLDFEIESSSELDDESPVDSDGDIESCMTTVNPDKITLTILINTLADDTENKWEINDTLWLAQLINLPKTKGVKAIYYPVYRGILSALDSRMYQRQLINWVGASDLSQNQGDINLTLWDGTEDDNGYDLTDVNYIGVRFTNCKMQQVPDSTIIKVTLTGVRTS